MSPSRIKAVAWFLLLGGFLAGGIGVLVGRHHEREDMPARDKADLVRDGDRLRHPTLGFSFLAPGPDFVVATEQLAMLRGKEGSGSHYYAYRRDSDPRAILIISVDNDVGGSEDSLRAFALGVERGFRQSQLSVTTIQNNTLWTQHVHESQIDLAFGEGHMRSHLYALAPADHAPIVVGLTVISGDEHSLDDVLGSLR